MRKNLIRITAYTSKALNQRLEIAATHPKLSKSEIINNALRLYLSPEQEAVRNNPLIRRLDQMNREQERLRQRLIVISEGQALFVRYFLTMVSPPPADKRAASKAEGEILFNGYYNALKVILSNKNRHLFNGIEDVFLAESDFFTEEELDALEINPPKKQSGANYDTA